MQEEQKIEISNQEEKKYFNRNSKTNNALKTAASGISSQILNLLLSFAFRTIFLLVLSKEYLGLNGLFTNILSILSLVELGVGSSIVFRMYKPIANNDVVSVGKYMRFYKKMYLFIGIIVLAIGLSLMPIIKFLIKDAQEIPGDINIYFVYFLFVFQSASSYFFVYKSAIFTADQRHYYIVIAQIISSIVSFAARVAILYIFKNYVATLIISICVGILQNFTLSIIAKKIYPEVFKVKENLTKEQIKEIKSDVFALICHKVGAAVISSTDNILLSSMIGLSVLGIYSNYSMIIIAVSGLVGQLFGTYTSTIGASLINYSQKENYSLYKNLNFLNFTIVSCASIMLFTLFNPFIEVWLNANMLLNIDVVITLAFSFFLSQIRHINISYVNASGLFRKDKWRPLIEALLNLVGSIVLVKFIGIAGIFLGTIISNLCVVFWREPYLIAKYIFNKKPVYFNMLFSIFITFTIVISVMLYYLFKLMPLNIGYLILRFIIAGVVPILIILATTSWTQEGKYFINKVKSIFNKIFAFTRNNSKFKN